MRKSFIILSSVSVEHQDDGGAAEIPLTILHLRLGGRQVARLPHLLGSESPQHTGGAEQLVLEHLRTHVPDARTVPLCGNSIATDRAFLARDMPELDGFLHYRMVDVSSVKELVRRWYPRVYFGQPRKEGGHRALADILDSIRELRYYRSTVFVELPGPDSAGCASRRWCSRDPATTCPGGPRPASGTSCPAPRWSTCPARVTSRRSG